MFLDNMFPISSMMYQCVSDTGSLEPKKDGLISRDDNVFAVSHTGSLQALSLREIILMSES